MMPKPLFFATALLFTASFANGQNAPVSEQTEQLKYLLARVELLE